jgi:hypothetical protein
VDECVPNADALSDPLSPRGTSGERARERGVLEGLVFHDIFLRFTA